VRIAMGCDHAGYELKVHVAGALREAGHEVVDVGTDSEESTDYALFAEPAARLVADGEAERGVLVCGSGVGVNIVANKVRGIRAVNAHDVGEVKLARQHNDVNVLTLSGRRVGADVADAIVETFLETDFEGGRHERRVGLISEVEKR
jgi:ribose 5-phosphate isomerase B